MIFKSDRGRNKPRDPPQISHTIRKTALTGGSNANNKAPPYARPPCHRGDRVYHGHHAQGPGSTDRKRIAGR